MPFTRYLCHHVAYQEDENAVVAGDRYEEHEEGLAKRLVPSSMYQQEYDHTHLNDEKNGPYPSLESEPDGPVICATGTEFFFGVDWHGAAGTLKCATETEQIDKQTRSELVPVYFWAT